MSAIGKPRRQAEILFQPERKIGQQSLLAAEEMRGAFDVEEKTVGAVFLSPGRSGRRVARRPERQPPQRRVIGGAIDRAGLHLAGFGARIGERFAER